MLIPFHRPYITEDEISEVVDSLKSGWLTTGSKCKDFERLFAEYIGCKHAVAVNSCTAALHLALEAIGLKEGEAVITSPMTFAATAEVVRYFNARPVFVDIEPDTMNMDVAKLEETIESLAERGYKIRAVIPVHFAGHSCDMDPLLEIAGKHDLRVVEDAAHILPGKYKDKNIGTISDITCFSFYANKNITTGEGGMAVTDNQEWADRMRIMSLHGISKDAWKRYSAEGNWYYEITAPGYKYNMTDMAAALGIAQLRKADSLLLRRSQIASRYNEAFGELPQLSIPAESSNIQHSWHLYVIKLNPERLTINRDRFMAELKSRGIGTSVHFIPLHIHPYYRNTYGFSPGDFPIAYEIFQKIVTLPIYPMMTDEEVRSVVEAVTDIVTRNSRGKFREEDARHAKNRNPRRLGSIQETL
ncbi:MAG: DegT/DnrJ/EryC1/StrS family aminotransferase [Nitrospirae bacterium]|nr:DegT/DnrJ/EryC1/StrS family aminotransferase [Nitrospirota bacterium]